MQVQMIKGIVSAEKKINYNNIKKINWISF